MASQKASFPSSVSASSSNPLPTFPSLLPAGNWFYTTATILVSLLILEQSVYRYKKRHLPGDKWTIPLIGKFADSMKPTMEGYMRQWNSGALSAISVFNMFVFYFRSRAYEHILTPIPSFIVMASTTKHAHKILNSPTYAEPCLVNSAKSVLCPDNWFVILRTRHP